MTSPGGDGMCYIMLSFMGEMALGRLLDYIIEFGRKDSFQNVGRKQ